MIKPAIYQRQDTFQCGNSINQSQAISFLLHPATDLIALRWVRMFLQCPPNAHANCTFSSAGQGGPENPFEYHLAAINGQERKDYVPYGDAPFPIPHPVQSFAIEYDVSQAPGGSVFTVFLKVAYNTQATLGI